ncbi:MAG: alpha-L-fucosidase [Paludibacter sp. 47-17]|nr:MAG: alpha-L-fucosidase [Paludibacter sp. 47-17]
MKKSALLLVLLFMMHHVGIEAQQVYQPTWESIDSRNVPGWFPDAKFGIFIHWGLYSVPAWAPTKGKVHEKYAEWYWARQNPHDKPMKSFSDFHTKTYGDKTTYTDFVSDFKAELFDPVQWADIFKQSGAKYVILTSKHHDGFALWPSDYSWNWNSVDVGPHRDLAGDLSNAVKAAGLHMGFYYSLYEWYNPLYKKNINKYVADYMIPQMKELVTRYRPEVLWTDGEWELPSATWKSTDFLAWLYNESPVKESIVVNDRWGKDTRGKHGGIYSTEYDLAGDQALKRASTGRPWEECRGIGGSFGYNRNENLEDYESSESLIYLLIDKVSKGGNLLLNIGPTADGRIPVIMQQRLRDMGQWLSVNGEAIYGTSSWKKSALNSNTSSQYFTAKGKDLYVIVTKWPNTPLTIFGADKADSVKMLGYEGKVRYKSASNRTVIYMPVLSPADKMNHSAWVFKLSGAVK